MQQEDELRVLPNGQDPNPPTSELAVPHPKGSAARVLLSSVYGPYARDCGDESRVINPMELFHNQVTREQGAFSLRVFHPTLGLRLIQANISAPCTVLDFPTIDLFERELSSRPYDIVGISSIVVNVGKLKRMCDVARRVAPRATIVVGGHVTAIPDLATLVDADHIVKGEGVAWMRHFLGEEVDAPIRHPAVCSSFGLRFMGLRVPLPDAALPAVVAPSVGCPLGCDFCCTSAFFGGKGKSHGFFKNGDELFDALVEIDNRLHSGAFFILDENFLLNQRQALELLDRIRAANKSWTFYVFSSANAIAQYPIETLVELGVSWIWIGLESVGSEYKKLHDVNTIDLVRRLREHGIRTLGSTIIGLPHHTTENVREEVDYAVSHEADFHQFMLYTPLPGTPLYRKSLGDGSLPAGIPYADVHGQFKFNFRHPSISRNDSKVLLDWAFRRDYEVNGPSVFRFFRTMLTGWRRYGASADPRLRRRVRREMFLYKQIADAALRAIELRLILEAKPVLCERVQALRQEFRREYDGAGRWLGAIGAPILLGTSILEQVRARRGWTYEPRPIVERRNWTT